MTLSITIQHTPWVEARVRALREMMYVLKPAMQDPDCFIQVVDTDYRGLDWQSAGKVQLELECWHKAAATQADHHVFFTDDLHLLPGITLVLKAMLAAVPNRPIGLLSNHPAGPSLYGAGHAWYKTNSWLVGPAYILPKWHLLTFLTWYRSLPAGPPDVQGNQSWYNGDSAINEWISSAGGGECWHPLPTPIEHRADVDSTVGHGDRYSRERVSWRELRMVENVDGGFRWLSEPHRAPPAVTVTAMHRAAFWKPVDPPMLVLPSGDA